MIDAAALERRLAGITPIGLSEQGTNRLAWTPQAAAAERWFREQAAATGLQTERDPAGNLWATPDTPPPWWGVGSHLDSVRDGGRFDGALGVAAAFEVAQQSALPVAVISFADEEGARFNTPTFGSRALAARLDVEEVLQRRDDDGVELAAALSDAGVSPSGLAQAPEWLARLRGFIELHIDQSRDVADAGFAAGVVGALAARMRVRCELRGAADHAGTTRRSARRDAMLAAARLIVAADELAATDPGLVATAGRILVEPNALTTIPARVRLWLDARAPDDGRLERWHAALVRERDEIAATSRVEIELQTQSRSSAVAFDPAVRAALVAAAGKHGEDPPEVVCFAGHDAGVLAARLPAGMVLVRNRSGISHAPGESVELDDAARAAELMLGALEVLG